MELLCSRVWSRSKFAFGLREVAMRKEGFSFRRGRLADHQRFAGVLASGKGGVPLVLLTA